ncbi:hypothetical protein [uncultured Nonlabens sp.]|uniref:hypothetical protein n=1 Tax=uncultured Nonlabens sp. TaxID=859306 RepID=UPI00261E354F|nr:hypothetical protein [uncultured Nonlabens sp.]
MITTLFNERSTQGMLVNKFLIFDRYKLVGIASSVSFKIADRYLWCKDFWMRLKTTPVF